MNFGGWDYGNASIVSINYSSSVNVSDDGIVSLSNPTYFDLSPSADGASNATSTIRGKFFLVSDNGNGATDFTRGVVYFCPENANFNYVSTVPKHLTIDRYQPVTGYAAIPAGTTIEYLGKLGDKARVQVVSYVGTGTYGESNKNSLTFNFSPRVLLIAMSGKYNGRIYTGILYPFSECGIYLAAGSGGGISELKCSKSNHEIFWWASDNNQYQLNISGRKYTAIAIG